MICVFITHESWRAIYNGHKRSNKIILKDILIGDIWFYPGQSNIVQQIELHSVTYANDIANANYPEIRHFWISAMTDLQGPHDNLPTGYWKSANPTDVRQFSAVTYFFAKTIYEKYHVPIGLINASVGGTPIKAGTREEGLREFPVLQTSIQKKDTAYINGLSRRAFTGNKNRGGQNDKEVTGPIPWYDITYIPKGWHTMNISGYWEYQEIKDLNG